MATDEQLELLADSLIALEPFIGERDALTVFETENLREANFTRLGNAGECLPCRHAAIFGWWGNPLTKGIGAVTHCKACHRSWRSLKEAHCTVCHSHFTSNEAASYHWNDKTGQHMQVEECIRGEGKGPRYSATETPFGVVWGLARFSRTS